MCLLLVFSILQFSFQNLSSQITILTQQLGELKWTICSNAQIHHFLFLISFLFSLVPNLFSPVASPSIEINSDALVVIGWHQWHHQGCGAPFSMQKQSSGLVLKIFFPCTFCFNVVLSEFVIHVWPIPKAWSVESDLVLPSLQQNSPVKNIADCYLQNNNNNKMMLVIVILQVFFWKYVCKPTRYHFQFRHQTLCHLTLSSPRQQN